MTDIYPAQDQQIVELIRELGDLDLTSGEDFVLHYSWDAKPFLKATPEAYEKWAAARGESAEDADADSSTKASKKAESSDSDNDESGAQSARRPAKRR